MLITPEQLQEIRQIVADHHEALIADVLGREAVTPEQLRRLVDQGLITEEGDQPVDLAVDPYVLGQLLALAEQKRAANWSVEQLHAHLRKNPLPLTETELQAVRMARERAGQYLRGLGNRVQTDVQAVLVEADAHLRERLRSEVRSATAQAIARRETARELRSELGWRTGDWTRDWDRIARTEQQAALREGQADALRRRYGPDVLVARIPMPDACAHCRELHLGPDGQPRIFPLSVLTRNGTNVGRKVAEWRSTVGPVHPHCRCQTVRVPAGWGFDEDGELVPGGKLGARYQSAADLEAGLAAEQDLRKGRRREGPMTYQGIPLEVENPVGSTRYWTDESGEQGETLMRDAYGFIRRTAGAGADGEEVDVFVGPDPRAPRAFVVEQQDPHTGRWDEQKVMLGYATQDLAEAAYRAHYDVPDLFLLYATPMELDHLQRWLAQPPPEAVGGQAVKLMVPRLRKATVEEYAHTRAGLRAPSPAGSGPNFLEGMIPALPELDVYTLEELIDRNGPLLRPSGQKPVLAPPDRYLPPEEPTPLAARPAAELLDQEREIVHLEDQLDSQDVQDRRAGLEREIARQAGETMNLAHPEDETEGEGQP